MNTRKKSQWLLVFFVLFFFSFFSISGMFANGRNVGLAEILDANSATGTTDSRVIMLGEEDDNFLQRFGKFFQDETVCSVNEDQYTQLSNLYTTSIEHVNVNGTPIDIAQVSGDGLTHSTLLDFLTQTSGSEVNCKVVQHRNIFYLLFNFQSS